MKKLTQKFKKIFHTNPSGKNSNEFSGTLYPYPDWPNLLRKDWDQWEDAKKKAKNGPRILIATGTGGHVPVAILDTYLAVALTLRGARVHFLICDQCLPACEPSVVTLFKNKIEFVDHGPSKSLCQTCFPPAKRAYASLKLPLHFYSEFITKKDLRKIENIKESVPFSEIANHRLDGIATGEHATAGALRYFARGNLNEEPFAEAILGRYFEAALLTAFALEGIFKKYDFIASSFHHGIYIPQGIVGEVARKHNIRVCNWQVAYRKKSFIFSHNETYHHTMLTESTRLWEDLDLSEKMEDDIAEYLKSRWKGTRDWIYFHEKPEKELYVIAKEVGVDFEKPCIGMLTNVMWDAQLHYRVNAFRNMLDWTLKTIGYFAKRNDLQLLVRVHPAEIRGTVPSRQPIEEEIRKVFSELPSNVFIISAESRVSTYAAMLQCNAVIIYGTKTGVELTSMGIPVIVGGEAWIRNKGLTMDASTEDEYFKILDRLPLEGKLEDEAIRRAKKYAFHFFFRRMIPISHMEPTDGWPPYAVRMSRLQELMPGEDRGTDIICDGIMKGEHFIFPAEKYPDAHE